MQTGIHKPTSLSLLNFHPMKYIALIFTFLFVLSVSVYAETDVNINARFLSLQTQVCPKIQDTAVKSLCEQLSAEFLPSTTKTWKVERVVDGDTVVLTQSKETVKVRLMGVDTPETKSTSKGVQCFGPEAYEFTKKQLEGKKVSITFDTISGSKDMYGRYLAYIYLGKQTKSFNQTLVEKGYAREYSMDQPYENRTSFQSIQKNAEEKKLGLWGACKETK